ncbi:MAG: hypothetical protein ACD_23C01004G0002 [uncultured bacterium]|nr:MAG: hypothetical protein ACD_23C01004G0002 [uncultured bacterium]
MQFNQAHVGLGDAALEVTNSGGQERHMFKPFSRQAVDQLNDDILQPTDSKAVNDMNYAPAALWAPHADITSAVAVETTSRMGSCARRKNASNMMSIHKAVEWS